MAFSGGRPCARFLRASGSERLLAVSNVLGTCGSGVAVVDLALLGSGGLADDRRAYSVRVAPGGSAKTMGSTHLCPQVAQRPW